MERSDNRRISKHKLWITLGVIVVALLYFIRLPFYLTMPGHAITISPMVEVGADEDVKQGELMLTTISMSRNETNLVEYALGSFKDYWELYPAEELRMDGESDEEYNQRQLLLMENSKEKATYAAFTAAGQPVERILEDALISYIKPGAPAEKHLAIGDNVKAIEGEPVNDETDLSNAVTALGEGDRIRLTIERDGRERNVEVPITKGVLNDVEKPMIGVGLTMNYSVTSDPEVVIKSEEIGGPSAGLMFSLEIYSRLVDQDITRGRSIAGTGTIDFAGSVGAIGGIKQKVVAADNAGADVFFAPRSGDNFKDADATAKDIQTAMTIVPVDTLEDAIHYLEALEPVA
ncbi:PDZ domain-containing protein [Bacillaceae bacterium SIJ1]|uniref:SepM family pheromone-processing serine protease n=1 Tax=Litoribacterium kuwaitense TaxID=1398745 RepID=UPI0013ED640A|nr:SepM family pheromone-processing serine protease [Litoribacterium kuwaitense]NGP44358.1 PDZ domain-containing protein [Litoribacterium kuwaitense]